MTVEVTGTYPTIIRKRSGLMSLDLALSQSGELGVPLRTIFELYGYTNVGKSTLAYYLAGKLTGKTRVVVCDLENADRAYIKHTMEQAGLSGTVKMVDTTDDKGKPVPHEVMLGDMATALVDNDTGAVILDSVGAIQPIAEAEGDFGEAFMGKRAKLVGQVSRSLVNTLRNKDRESIALVINHVHSVIGGRGHITAGGETLKFLSAVRIMLWPKETFTDDKDNAIGFLVSGRVEKLRYGGKGRTFNFYIVPGFGIHVGATAMFDCFDFGLAERGTTVKVGKKSLGYIKKEFLEYAYTGKQRKFTPFVELLKENEGELSPARDFTDESE